MTRHLRLVQPEPAGSPFDGAPAVTSTSLAACRVCGGALGTVVCDLGVQPLANSYPRSLAEGLAAPRVPLAARVCDDCRLVQLTEAVDPAAIFTDYAYRSGYSGTWLTHCRDFADATRSRLGLGAGSLVVEVASNDGCLLRNFTDAGIPGIGVEPGRAAAMTAIAAGVPTVIAFLDRSVARRLLRDRGRAADLVIANNVLAHVPDVNEFVASLALLAGETGVLSIEVPHLLELVRQCQFDTIYHEHYSYWSLASIERLLARHELRVFDVARLSIHGGSLRISACHQRATRPEALAVAALRREEAEAGVHDAALYAGFDRRVRAVIAAFCAYLDEARREGRRVAAFGAAAKGSTFLNAAGVTAGELMAVADSNPAKQDRLLPGSLLPIVSPAQLVAMRPDDIVALPWNIAPELRAMLAGLGWRGRFVTAVPQLRIEDVRG